MLEYRDKPLEYAASLAWATGNWHVSHVTIIKKFFAPLPMKFTHLKHRTSFMMYAFSTVHIFLNYKAMEELAVTFIFEK